MSARVNKYRLLAGIVLGLMVAWAWGDSDDGGTRVTAAEACVPATWEMRRRRRPGNPPPPAPPCETAEITPRFAQPPPDFIPVPDRWRIVSDLGYPTRLWDPYHGNNPLKGDRPVFGEDWFVSLGLVSDSVLDVGRVPAPVGVATTDGPGSLDVLGDPDFSLFNQTMIVETVLYQGDTVFRPPDYEFRFTPVFNFNRLSVEERGIVNADPGKGTTRNDHYLGIQALFVDKHLRNVSENYDFDSLRVGIQPITADFRGFLFIDSPIGVRLFGTRRNNHFQYNLGWFRRLDKDTNSGLNDIGEIRDEDIFLANLYAQDFPWLGFTTQAVVAHTRNREGDDVLFDENGFIQRPASIGLERGRDYDVTYLGINGDGHIGRYNLTFSAMLAVGDEDPSTFFESGGDIAAFFAATEISRDFDWWRLRASMVYGSGDDDPFDDEANGFDAIVENPLIGGADTSYWIRNVVPLIGGGRVALSTRNGLLNSLRSSREFGQANFSNPGIALIGVGADLDLTARLRVALNANQLWFDDTATLEVARAQAPIDKNIGQDLSMAVTYRPLISQNIVLRASAAVLNTGSGYEDLYGSKTPYFVLLNAVFAY